MRYSTQDEISALGNPIEQYKLSEAKVYYLFIFFSLSTCFYGWLSFSSWRSMDFTHRVGLSLFTLAGLGAALIHLHILWKRTRIIRLFEHGVSFECRAGHVVMPWKIFQEITVDSSDRVLVKFILCTRDEKKLTVYEEVSKISKQTREKHSQQMNFAEVIQYITEKSYGYRLETALSLYEAGKQIDFKRFQVSKEGIHVKKKTLPWQQMSAFRTNENETVLAIIKRDQKRPWKVIHSQDIPNEDVLAGVVTAYYPQLVG